MLEVREHGVKVSVVMPGSVTTHFNEHVPSDDGRVEAGRRGRRGHGGVRGVDAAERAGASGRSAHADRAEGPSSLINIWP